MPSHEEMLLAGMHYGRKKTVRHPKMNPYLYALRDSIYLINVFKTEEKLKAAIEFLRKIKEDGGMILWSALSKHSEEKIIELAELTDMPYIKGRWLGGALTNFKTIKDRVKYFKELEKKLSDQAELEKLTKKEKFGLEKEFKLLKEKFEGLDKMIRLPDTIFLISLKEGQMPLKEAKKLGIKIVAICNTESDPTSVDYPIPANDNSKQSVGLILETIKKALV